MKETTSYTGMTAIPSTEGGVEEKNKLVRPSFCVIPAGAHPLHTERCRLP